MQSILGLILISLLFFIKRDGYFPFTSTANPVLIYSGNTLLLIFFILAMVLVIWPLKFNLAGPISKLLKKHLKLLAIITLIMNILGICLLTIHAYSSFREFYTINYQLLFICSVMGIALPLIFLLKQKPKTALAMLFLMSLVFSILIISFFPTTAKLSDLMPIVTKQGQAFLSGQNIYRYYLLDNGVNTQAVRQPGIMLLYLPAVIFNFDPRILSSLYFLAAGFMLLKFACPDFSKIKMNRQFYLSFIVLSLFLLMPYRFLRMDLYEPPFWFIFIISLYFLFRDKLKTFALLWGIGICTQVWCWIGTPFIVIYLFRKYGFKKTISTSILFSAIGLGILALFILPNPQSYFEHVFGFYKNTQDAGIYPKVSMFLTPWVYELGWQKYLQVFQIIVSSGVGLLALVWLKSFQKLLVFLALIILVFIQFLVVSWTYMYLNIYFLLIVFSLIQIKPSTKKIAIESN